MADLTAEIMEARAEFDMFGAYMQTPQALQQQRQKEAGTSAPSTELGTTPTPTPAPSQDGSEHMEVDKDREKRAADQAAKDAPPPSKWAKGDAKGDNRLEEAQTGKGRAMDGPPQQSQAARGSGQGVGPGAGPGSLSQDNRGMDKTENQAPKQTSQQLAHWKKAGNYRQWPSNQGGGNQRWESKEARELRELKEAVKALGRMSLRMEDALGVIHLDSEYILFLQTEAAGNEWAITRQLYDTAVEWNRQKEQDPSALTNPMRNILLYNLYNALLMKIEALEVDKNLMEAAKTRGLVEGTTYVFLQWDQATRRHVKATAQPIEHEEAVQMVKHLRYLAMFPNVVGRFHALRRMEDNLNGDIIPFSLVAQNRTAESHQLFSLMGRLARNSIWHLIAATMRPAKPSRSPLAKYVDKLVKQL